MPQTIHVRDAYPQDWPTVTEGNVAMAGETEDKALDPPTVRAGVQAALADPAKGRYFIAEIDGQYAGQTLVTREWSDWRNAWFWWIQSVYVAPAWRRRGVFRALHGHIRAAARSAGDVCGLRLYVERENITAIQTYAALNMRDAGYLLLEEDWSGGTAD